MITDIDQIQKILSDNTDFCLVDQIELLDHRGVKEATIALGLELFIPPRDSSILYPQLTELMADYYQRFRLYLDACTSLKSGKKIRTGKNYKEKLQHNLNTFDLKTIYAFYLLQNIQIR